VKQKQIFPIFDPITEDLLGYKERELVHRDGDWHRGIQANVYRNTEDGCEILVQRRSSIVDIGKGKLDQSLATQMIDKDALDEDRTLFRGLKYELGITRFHSIKMKTTMRIVKTYDEQPGILNKELLSLYLVEIDAKKPVHAVSPKVQSLEWWSWKKFKAYFAKHPDHFTKTAQFYFGTPKILAMIEELMFTLFILDNKQLEVHYDNAFTYLDYGKRKETHLYERRNQIQS